MPLMYPGGNLQKQPGKPLVLGYINYLLFKMHALRAALQCSTFFAVSKIPPQSLFPSLDRFHQVNHRAFRMAGLQAHKHLQQAPIHDVEKLLYISWICPNMHTRCTTHTAHSGIQLCTADGTQSSQPCHLSRIISNLFFHDKRKRLVKHVQCSTMLATGNCKHVWTRTCS